MTIRPDVVSLLADLDPDPGQPPATWPHRDGRPLTTEETDLAGSATTGELGAAADYAARVAQHHAERAADLERAHELMAPWFAELGEGATTRDVLRRMPRRERDEVAAILERLAPA